MVVLPSSESKSCRPREPVPSSKWSYSQRRDNFPRSIPKLLDPPKLARSYGSVLRAIPVTGSWTLLCNKISQTTPSALSQSTVDTRVKQNYLATVRNSSRRSAFRLTFESVNALGAALISPFLPLPPLPARWIIFRNQIGRNVQKKKKRGK